jgi:hypothetical protein
LIFMSLEAPCPGLHRFENEKFISIVREKIALGARSRPGSSMVFREQIPA